MHYAGFIPCKVIDKLAPKGVVRVFKKGIGFTLKDTLEMDFQFLELGSVSGDWDWREDPGEVVGKPSHRTLHRPRIGLVILARERQQRNLELLLKLFQYVESAVGYTTMGRVWETL